MNLNVDGRMKVKHKNALKWWTASYAVANGERTLTIEGANLDEVMWALRKHYSAELTGAESLTIKPLKGKARIPVDPLDAELGVVESYVEAPKAKADK